MQLDHVQIKIVAIDSNKNGLNPKTNPAGIYFISLNNKKWRNYEEYQIGDLVNLDDKLYKCLKPHVSNMLLQPGSSRSEGYWDKIGENIYLKLTLKTLIESVATKEKANIFDINGILYPQFYKMQIRLGINTNPNPYDESWGQVPAEGWINNNATYFSEWSNSARVKTVKKPELAIITNEVKPFPYMNILDRPQVLWHGAYSPMEDNNESLQAYSFKLYEYKDEKVGALLEEQPLTYIEQYEIPSPQYQFKYVMEAQNEYVIRFHIVSSSGYEDYIDYVIRAGFPKIRLHNVFNVKENDEKAYIRLKIFVKQIQLIPTEGINEDNWLSDQSMIDLGEGSYTHYKLTDGKIITPDYWIIPYNNFTLQISITNFQEKIQTKAQTCFIDNNHLFAIGSKDVYGSDYKGGVYYNERIGKTVFILKEELKLVGKQNSIINYYYQYYEEDLRKIEDKEFFILIIKDGGRTKFEINQWLTNNWQSLKSIGGGTLDA